MSADINKFLIWVSNVDFESMIGMERWGEFLSYISECQRENQEEIVLRFLFQMENPDGVPTPYYVWVTYPFDTTIEGEGEVDIYIPDFDEYINTISMPPNLDGKKYFRIDSLGGGTYGLHEEEGRFQRVLGFFFSRNRRRVH